MNARTSRRLRVVENHPKPDSDKRLVFGHDGYGCGPIERLPHNPPANEIAIRARAQSIESKGGKRAELRSYEEALEIIAADEAAKRT